MVLSNTDENVYLIDNEENTLKIVDTCGKFIKTLEMPKLLGTRPSALCFNSKNELFIGDSRKRKILVFNKKHEFVREFGDNTIKKPDSMIIDEITNILYISDYENNQISLWNTETCSLLTQFKVDSPAQMHLNKDFLYVISEGDYDFIKSTGKLRITKGSNCIFILNKQTYQLYDTIKLDNWFDCAGLHLDKNGNLITTAYELDSDKYVSAYRMLYVFNSNGKLQNKIPTNIDYFSDMLFVDDKKIAFCAYDKFKLIELE
jgi:DNA-binding beta-propeller fold protein YncE